MKSKKIVLIRNILLSTWWHIIISVIIFVFALDFFPEIKLQTITDNDLGFFGQIYQWFKNCVNNIWLFLKWIFNILVWCICISIFSILYCCSIISFFLWRLSYYSNVEAYEIRCILKDDFWEKILMKLFFEFPFGIIFSLVKKMFFSNKDGFLSLDELQNLEIKNKNDEYFKSSEGYYYSIRFYLYFSITFALTVFVLY